MRFLITGEKDRKDHHGHGHGNGHWHGHGNIFEASTGDMMEAVMETVENPPKTWTPYLEKGDYKGIYDMENAELGRAFKASMEGKASMKDVVREIRHTFAAMLLCQAHALNTDNAETPAT